MTTTNADLIAAEWQTEIERPYVEMLDALTAKLAESELEFNQCSSMLNNAERGIEELEQQLAEAQKDAGAKQAQIDRLMLEYCPDEMTVEQVAAWGNHQRSTD